MRLNIIAALFIALLWSCGGSTEWSKYDPMFREVLKSDSGLFRSIDFGMSMEQVKSKEDEKVSEEEEDYLYYDVFLSADSLNSYTLAYTFDSTGLTNIEADLYAETEEKSHFLMGSFRDYFDKKYGQGLEDKGFITWRFPREGETIAFCIADESESTDSPLISLSIYRED